MSRMRPVGSLVVAALVLGGCSDDGGGGGQGSGTDGGGSQTTGASTGDTGGETGGSGTSGDTSSESGGDGGTGTASTSSSTTSASGSTVTTGGSGSGSASTGTGTETSGTDTGTSGGTTGGSSGIVYVDFETEVYPLFSQLACVGCHSATGEGYILRDGYYADLSVSVDEVYVNLVAAGITCDRAAPGRVCVNDPLISLLVQRPLAEVFPEPEDHPNASFDDVDDPILGVIIDWIDQGALRYPPP